METFKTYCILGLICFSVALIRYMAELYHLEFGTVSHEILEKILDALWVAILISLLIGHLIEKASYEKIKEVMRNTSSNIEKSINMALDDGRKILKANEDASIRSQQNMFFAAFRQTIPQDVFDAAKKGIFGAKFYRKNHVHAWRFKELKVDGFTRLATHVTANYTIYNLTGTPEDFTIRMQMDRSTLPPDGEVVSFIQVDGKKQDFQLKEYPEVAGDPNVVFEILSIVIPGNGSVNIRLESQLLRKLEDSETWLTPYPQDGMELRIYDPDNCNRIKFEAEAIGPMSVQPIQSTDGMTALIHETMLPYQGLKCSWKYEVIDASSALP